jgi:hypothetical protein
MMDSKLAADGRQYVSLGPVERWAASVVAAGFVACCVWFGNNVTQRLEDQNKAIQSVVTNQAVMNGQVQTLTIQLADVPRLTREVAEIRVQVSRHEQDIREMNRRK